MRNTRILSAIVFGAAALAAIAGCQRSSEETPPPPSQGQLPRRPQPPRKIPPRQQRNPITTRCIRSSRSKRAWAR